MARTKEFEITDIIKESAKFLLNKPIEQITFQYLASKLNIGEATLYRYFKNKENYIIASCTYLWSEMQLKYFSSIEGKNGYDKIKYFYGVFIEMYKNGNEYLRLLNNFDSYIISKSIDEDKLQEYEKQILSLKEIFMIAYHEGMKDGSLKSTIDYNLFYFTSTHSMLMLAEKLSKKAILNTDKEIKGTNELETMIEIFLSFIKKENN